MPTELERINVGFEARAPRLTEPHNQALRLFNGFTEGDPSLIVELYGRTLVLFDYAADGDEAKMNQVAQLAKQRWPWLNAALWKQRRSSNQDLRNGSVLFGSESDYDRRIEEDGVKYTLKLDLNRDASLYLDTRPLRQWLKKSMSGKRVLNTFAYTGALGVAAKAGGASHVVQLDLNKSFLNVAKDSFTLNGFEVKRIDFRTGDFFVEVGRLKRENALFDCVILDPPLQSVTEKGRFDLQAELERLVNKLRPLVAHEGALVLVVNALFVSGKELLERLEALCADGYLTVAERIDAPDDVAGLEQVDVKWPADPKPFNSPSKMVVLRAKRKDGRA